MEWTMPETVTFGAVAFAVIILLYRFIGQRPDSNLIILQRQTNELLGQSLEGFAELRGTLDKHAEGFAALSTGITTSFQAILTHIDTSKSQSMKESNELIEVFRSFTETVKIDHKSTLTEILKISPKIEELAQAQTAKTKQSEGLQTVMDNAITNQIKILKEIQAAVIRIEKQLSGFKSDIANIEADVEKVKGDLGRVQVASPPPPMATPEFIAPIESQKPKSKPTEEKDKPNE